MIEKTLFIENAGNVLVTLNHRGEMHWTGAPDTEVMRGMIKAHNYPNLYWYRCSTDMEVYSAANGTPKYRLAEELPGFGKYNAMRVREFVERLNAVLA